MSDILNGLVLVGGKSKRMGKDKSSLSVDGTLLLDTTSKLLLNYCKDVFVSCRDEQDGNTHLKNRAKIYDSVGDIGPLGGIISALKKLNSDIFVIACDLPNLNKNIMDNIFKQYSNTKNKNTKAITYFNTQRGHIEPLCSIYKLEILKDLEQKANENIYCPNKILSNLDNVVKIDLKQNDELKNLANMNTPQEYFERTNSKLDKKSNVK
jgi:molybdopterin-guanine dinucleotide biosynthesis protein A